MRHVPSQAAPLPLEVLEWLCQAARGRGATGAVFAMLLSAAFFAMTRLSSLVPPEGGPFDTSRFPLGSDVQCAVDRVWLHIKWAKAHQGAEQAFWVPLLPLPGSPACPVRAFASLREAAGPNFQTRPLFAFPGRRAARSAHATGFTRRVARE